MENFLRQGIVGNIELNEQKRIRETINNRWEQIGLTAGLPGVIKENVATLYEKPGQDDASGGYGCF